MIVIATLCLSGCAKKEQEKVPSPMPQNDEVKALTDDEVLEDLNIKLQLLKIEKILWMNLENYCTIFKKII